MESVDSIQELFPEGEGTEDVSELPKNKSENQKVLLNMEDLNASIEEIEKLDVVLKTKITEEKKAKLCRIEAEEELRGTLTELLSSEISNGIKINLQKFMKLLNEVEEPQSDSSEGLREDDPTQDNGKKEEKKEKPPNSKFIERNIQLAKCGRGTLSLTEEEKLRIENLLVNIEDSEKNSVEELKKTEVLSSEIISDDAKQFYGMDEETKNILNEIDQRLEMLMKEKKGSQENRNNISLSKKTENEEKQPDEDERENSNKIKLKKKESNRLKEINELLNSMNSVSNEKINPLTVKEIESLIQQSEQSLSLGKSLISEEKQWPNSKPPKEVIAELVSNAKLLMPKFQYRFDEP